jgi:Na+/H+-dicarboxylate symporter
LFPAPSASLQAHGVHLGAADLAVVALTASLAAIGAPAIPSAGLVTMLIVLQVGVLQAGVGRAALQTSASLLLWILTARLSCKAVECVW